MKKIFKIFSLLALALLGAISVAGCVKTEAKDVEGILKNAGEYAYNQYKSLADATVSDSFEVTSVVMIGAERVGVTWSLSVEGSQSGVALRDKSETAKLVYVGYYDGLISEETNVTLEPSFTLDGVTKSATELVGQKGVFKFKVNPLVIGNRAAWEALATDKNTSISLRGRVLGVVAEGSSSAGSFYFQDEAGFGYYAYKPATKAAVKAGDVVIVSGKRSDYSGQQEFGAGCTFHVIEGATQELIVHDASADFAAAADNKDFNQKYQNNFVELKNCTPIRVDGSYYYFKVGDGAAEFNIYDTYYFLSKEQQAAFVAAWNNAVDKGMTGTIKGISTVYSSAIQIYGSPEFPEILFGFTEATDEEKLVTVETMIKAQVPATKIQEEKEIVFSVPSYASITAIAITAAGGVLEDTSVAATEEAAAKWAVKVTPQDAASEATFTVTVKVGELTKAVELKVETVSLLVRPEMVTELDAAKSYHIYVLLPSKTVYATGQASGNYLATSVNPMEAGVFKIEDASDTEATDDFYLSTGTGDAKKYVKLTGYSYQSNGETKYSVKIELKADAKTPFTYNATFNTLVGKQVDITDEATGITVDYEMGTYESKGTIYETLSASKLSYLSEDNIEVTQFPIHFTEAKEFTSFATLIASGEKGTKYSVQGVVIAHDSYGGAVLADKSGVMYLYSKELQNVSDGTYVELSNANYSPYKGLAELSNTAEDPAVVDFYVKNITIDLTPEKLTGPELLAKYTFESAKDAGDFSSANLNGYYKVTGLVMKVGEKDGKPTYSLLSGETEIHFAMTAAVKAAAEEAGLLVEGAKVAVYAINTGVDKDADGVKTIAKLQVLGFEDDSMVTVSHTVQELMTAYSWANGTQYLSFKLEGTAEGVVTVTGAGGSNAGKYYTSGYEWRLYNGGSETPDSMTISVPEGYKLVSVKITYNSGNNGILVVNDAAFTSGSVDTTCAGKTSVTFKAGNSGTATNGQAKITAIEVAYLPPKETA